MAATTSVKVKSGLKERLEQLAKEDDRSPHWLMNRAIEEYLDRREWQRQLDKDSGEAWEDYKRTGLHLTNEEVIEWMDKVIAGENPPMPKPHT